MAFRTIAIWSLCIQRFDQVHLFTGSFSSTHQLAGEHASEDNEGSAHWGGSGIFLFVQQLPEDRKQEQEDYRNDILNPFGQINELLQCSWIVHAIPY